jgi:hypothetical protein
MSTTTPNPNHHFAPTVARAIVRIWPRESRQWGQAFAAELPSIETATAVTSWLIGGVMLLLREWFKHAWRALFRPIGSSHNDNHAAAFTPRYSRTLRTPLWLILALTLSSAALLLHPEVRQVLRNLRYTYTQSGLNPSEWSSVKTLRRISESNRDPQLLALLSLLSDNDDQRLQLSDEAIAEDPSLTWLDYEQSLLPIDALTRQHYLSKQRLDRLIQWDPQNAVPHLLAAEIISNPQRRETFDAVMFGKPTPDWKTKIAGNPGWNSEMHKAFTAPKYDSYTPQLVKLIRDVSSRFSVNDPNIAVQLLTRKRLPQYDVLRAYADLMIDRGAAFEKNQKTEQAIAAYSDVLQFAERMSLDKEIPAEEGFARQIGLQACEKLLPIYTSAGRASEASPIQFQMAEWKPERQPKLMRYIPVRYADSPWSSIAWSGLIIQLAGLSLLWIVPVATISLLLVLSRKKTPAENRTASDFIASLGADAGPWLLFATTVLLYLTYHPYAKICTAFLTDNFAAPDIETFMTAAIVPDVVPYYAVFIQYPYSIWFGITSLLSLILIFVLWHMLLRSKKSAIEP